jgi:hypothetical protein
VLVSVELFLYLIAVIFLCLAAFGVSLPRVHFGWLGLAVWLLAAGILPALT